MNWWQALLVGAGGALLASTVAAGSLWALRKTYRATYDRVLTFLRPVAYPPPKMSLDSSATSWKMHFDDDRHVVGHVLSLKFKLENRGQGDFDMIPYFAEGNLVSHEDPRCRVRLYANPFHDVGPLSPGDLGPGVPRLRIKSGEQLELNLSLISSRYGIELPGDRVDCRVTLSGELTPRPGRLPERVGYLGYKKHFEFRLRGDSVESTNEPWTSVKVAVARELGVSESDIEERLLPGEPD